MLLEVVECALVAFLFVLGCGDVVEGQPFRHGDGCRCGGIHVRDESQDTRGLVDRDGEGMLQVVDPEERGNGRYDAATVVDDVDGVVRGVDREGAGVEGGHSGVAVTSGLVVDVRDALFRCRPGCGGWIGV